MWRKKMPTPTIRKYARREQRRKKTNNNAGTKYRPRIQCNVCNAQCVCEYVRLWMYFFSACRWCLHFFSVLLSNFSFGSDWKINVNFNLSCNNVCCSPFYFEPFFFLSIAKRGLGTLVFCSLHILLSLLASIVAAGFFISFTWKSTPTHPTL